MTCAPVPRCGRGYRLTNGTFLMLSNLARAEMQEALTVLAAALPDLAVDGEPEWPPQGGIYGPVTLPIRFTGPASSG